jgi:hypothetical protein
MADQLTLSQTGRADHAHHIITGFLDLPMALVSTYQIASFLSRGFTTMAVINHPERKLAKRTSVQCLHYHQAWPPGPSPSS